MTKKLTFFLLALLMAFCAPSTRVAAATSASNNKKVVNEANEVEVRGIHFLEKIKETIDSAIEEDNASMSPEILWPHRQKYYEFAIRKLAQLYSELQKNTSPLAENCMAYIEDFLEQLSTFSSNKLHRNDPKVQEYTNKTLTHLLNASEDLTPNSTKSTLEPEQRIELSPQDKKTQEQALQFVRFTRLIFLPPSAIHSKKTSWLTSAQEKVSDLLEEHPFMCGVAAAMVVIGTYFAYKHLAAPQVIAGGTNRPRADEYAAPNNEAENEAREAEQEEAALAVIDQRKKATEDTDYEVVGVQVAKQGTNTCAWHSAANAAAVTGLLETKRKEKANLSEEEKETLRTTLDALKQAEKVTLAKEQETERLLREQSETKQRKTQLKTRQHQLKTSILSAKARLETVAKEQASRGWWARLWHGTKEDEQTLLQTNLKNTQIERIKTAIKHRKLCKDEPLLKAQLQTQLGADASTTAVTPDQLQEVQHIQEKISRTELTRDDITEVLSTLGTTTLPSTETIEQEKAEFIKQQRLKIASLQGPARQAQTDLVRRLTGSPAISEDEAVLFCEYLLKKASMNPDTVSVGRNHSGRELPATAPLSVLRDDTTPSTLTTVSDYAQNSMEREIVETYTDFEGKSETDQAEEIRVLETVIRKNLRYNGEQASNDSLGVEDWDAMTANNLSEQDAAIATHEPGKRIAALKQARELATKKGNPYPQILTQLQAGKTVVVATRAPEGWHWTSHVLVPNTAPPTKIQVFHMDSNNPGTRSIYDTLRCLIYDAIHLRLPTEDSPAIQRLNQAFDCATILRRISGDAVPHMRDKTDPSTGEKVKDQMGRVARERFKATPAPALPTGIPV